jgi:thioester reductase-like protein
LASWRQTRPVHFVSTLSVFPETYADQGLVLETDLPLAEEDLQTGYGQSKWVAEQLVREAQNRGLPATIHRFGTLVGDSRMGMTHKPNDFFFSLIKGCLQLGKAPHLLGQINLTPVNYATQAMVYLTQQSTNWGQTFHVINPSSTSWETLLKDLQAHGYCLETEPFSLWLSALKEQIQAGYSNELATFLSILNGEEDLPIDNIEFDTTLSQAILFKSSIICPQVNAHFLGNNLSEATHCD